MTYLLTFNCYGTHLPGDERGWVERARGEQRGSYQDPRPELVRHARQITPEEPYQLDLMLAWIVLAAVRETCGFRSWDLLAAHVRTTHVHVVADGFSDPDRAITDLKAYASRALSQYDPAAQRKRWARGGSTRALFTADSISAAIKYVADQQGEPMAVYVIDPSEPKNVPLLTRGATGTRIARTIRGHRARN
jgi:hypothetical protein